jgi:hypothetical protein
MKNFLLDLWYDLREKRLWPVAALLLAALVATPVVLSKKAEEPEPAPMTAAAAPVEADKPEGPAALANVKLEELAKGSGSSLSSFDPRNPFAPPRKAIAAARHEAEGSSVSAPSTATSAGAGSGAGSGGQTDGGPAGVDLTSDSGGGTVPDLGGYTPPASDDGGGEGDETKVTEYTYVVDVTFRANDRTRTRKGLRKLDMLLDAESPLLIFVGVTEKAGSAVFMVDSTLHPAGEGRCKPSPGECASLALGPGSEHEFTTDEGDSYMLRVDEIRRVKVGPKASASTSKKNNQIASAALRPHASAGRVVPDVLTDLVSVSSGEGDNSNSDVDRR